MPVGDGEALRRLVAATADVVRLYVEKKAGFPATKRTTRGTLDALAPFLTPQTRGRLAEFLRTADLVKFAGHAPPAEVVPLVLLRARETASAVAEECTRDAIAS